MHHEILNNAQNKILPLIKIFSKSFYLAGDTAIALYLGHRQSIDFDLFSKEKIKRKSILNIIEKNNYNIDKIIISKEEELTLIIDKVKLTFLEFPYKINHKTNFKDIISVPDLLDLSAMKAFALGRRAKWKDYVDLYFILQNQFTINEIIKRATIVFGDLFDKKHFINQLCYFNDIDYSEKIEWAGKEIDDSVIKEFLTELSLQSFQ